MPLTRGNDGNAEGYIHSRYMKGGKEIETKSRPFLPWIKRKRTDRAHKNYTHLSMDGYMGGMLTMSSMQDETNFIVRYAQELDSGNAFTYDASSRLYICECRTPIFKFFVDIDCKFTKAIYYFNDDKKKLICKIIERAVRLFYPENTPPDKFTMMIADTSFFDTLRPTSTPSSIVVDDIVLSEDEREEEIDINTHVSISDEVTNPISSNMHIIFPNILVNQEQAIIMGKAIAIKLEAVIGHVEQFAKNWFDVVDPSVYLKNGLRMIGSRKCEKCPVCKNKKEAEKCTSGKCSSGRIDLGKVYKLRWVLQGVRNFVNHLALGNTAAMIRSCSIRAPGVLTSTEHWKKYDGCPSVDSNLLRRLETQKKELQDETGITENVRLKKLENLTNKPVDAYAFEEDEEGIKTQRSMRVEIDPPTKLFQEIVLIVRSFHPAYQNTIVKSVSTNVGYTYYRAILTGEGSTVCQNLSETKKEHSNNTVYMIIKPTGTRQHCWCRCDNVKDRKYGKCENFQSEKVPLSVKSKIILFPTFAKQTRSKRKNCFTLGGIVPKNITMNTNSNQVSSAMDNVVAYYYYKGYVEDNACVKKAQKKNKS
jgi:hypothetical protein